MFADAFEMYRNYRSTLNPRYKMAKPFGYDEYLKKLNGVEGYSTELEGEVEELGGLGLARDLTWTHEKKIKKPADWSTEEYNKAL